MSQASSIPYAAAEQPLRPNLLRILGVFAQVRVAIAVLFILAVGLNLLAQTPLAALPLISALVLLALTQLPGIQQRMGEWHLKLVLGVATLDTLLVTGLFTQWFFSTYVAPLRLSHGLPGPIQWLRTYGVEFGQYAPPVAPLIVLMSLFVILLVISWHYPLRYALGFVIITMVIDSIGMWTLPLSPTQVFSGITIALARTLIFTILAVVIAYLVNVQNQQQQALRAANTKLMRHMSTVEELAVSQERNRLARELHDTLAHTLSAASVQLEATQSLWVNDRERAQTAVLQALKTTRQGLAETRRALSALRATPLEDLGFELALKELSLLAEQRSAARMTLAYSLPAGSLAPHVEQALYRVAQEAFDNIVRHANATQIECTLRMQDGALHMRITDNGAGFDVSAARKQSGHFGLNGLIERVESLGGRITIDSWPGAGTRIMIDIDGDRL
jgi:signal transduction histidine kinase